MKLQDSKELQDVIGRCLKGDRKAQQKLFSLSYPLAMNVCRRYVQDLDEAKSLVNEGMLKVFNQLGRYSPQLSFGGWVRRIMVNTAIDHYRKMKSHQERFRDLEDEEFSASYHDDIVDRISADELLALVQELPPAYRMVFSLYAVEEYTHKEIAEHLGISEGTSKSNYAKAKAKLQKAFSSLHALKENADGQTR
ncbi:MAG: RNA polymerase sigma factor [Cyclobacteriaceae bacterium]